MNWTLLWSAVAEQDLRAIPWRLAARMDASLMALSEGRSGEGHLERISEADSRRLRLRMRGGINALLWVDAGAGIIYVVRVLRSA